MKGFENTQALLKNIQDIMNTNPKIQGIMDELAKQAEAKGMSLEQWNEGKEKLFAACFYKMLMMDEGLRNMVAEEMGRKIWNEAHGIQ